MRLACVEASYFDDFLAFPAEYVALLGLSVLFIVLFVIVVIIICVTARVSQQPHSLLHHKPPLWPRPVGGGGGIKR